MNDWPAEARVDAHHEDQVGDVEDVLDRALVRRRVQDDARALAEVTDVLQRPVKVGARLDVDGDPVRAGRREVLEVPLGLDDHQVHVERRACVAARIAFTTAGPIVMLGTKRPSITST